jgi:hypothetical protein
VRSTHYDWNASSTDCVGYAIGFFSHPGHRPNANQSYFVVPYVFNDLLVGHCAGVPINQQHFMTGRCQCLEKKHPEMWHVVSCHTIVRAIKQNLHMVIRRSVNHGVQGAGKTEACGHTNRRWFAYYDAH